MSDTCSESSGKNSEQDNWLHVLQHEDDTNTSLPFLEVRATVSFGDRAHD
jgi:hypothetical protein